ncbi:hypothetical protein QL285_069519 [Trifolium repens]|nr:hypothetical protein QL285_069519 [Trifolium repens]
MGDQPITRAELEGLVTAVNALTTQMATLTTQVNNIALNINNNNRDDDNNRNNNNNINAINILSIGAYAPKKIDAVSLSIESLDENEPSLPEKLNDPANHSKPKEVEVVVEQDTSVEVDKSKDEKKGIEKETKEKEEHVTNLWSSATQYDATSRIAQTEEHLNIIGGKHRGEETPTRMEKFVLSVLDINVSFQSDTLKFSHVQIVEPLEVDTWTSQTFIIQYHDYCLVSEVDVNGTSSSMLTEVGQTSFYDKFPNLCAIFDKWDPGGNLDVLTRDRSSHFTQWDPGGWSLVHWRSQHAREAHYQNENSGSSSLEVEEKIKTSKAYMYGASTQASDSSTQTFVFDPGIRVREFRIKTSLYYNRTRGRILHKKMSLMQEQFNATAVDKI